MKVEETKKTCMRFIGYKHGQLFALVSFRFVCVSTVEEKEAVKCIDQQRI